MKIHLYTICWNEEAMWGFFFKHYDPWIDRYIIFNDGSTDKTLEILKQHPKVEIRPFPRLNKESYILSAQMIHNQCWKECRGCADWVVIIDVDEHLYHPHIKSYLQQCAQKGITVIPALGYQMISNDFPAATEKLCETRINGAPFISMDKLCIFNPNAIEEINYVVGRHNAAPTGNVVYPKINELLNLHYKYLSFAYVSARHKQLDDKRDLKDRENNFGYHYAFSKERLYKAWKSFEKNAVNVMLPSSLTLRQQLYEKELLLKNIDQTILTKNLEIKKLNELVASNDTHIQNLNEIITDKDIQINNIFKTISWRITKPLRFIKSKII